MKKRFLLLFTLVIPFLSSCIKDEPLNREADIVEVRVDDPTFIDRSISEGNRVDLIMSKKADLTSVAPVFTLSPNARVIPASGKPVDLSDGKEVIYTVISESGEFYKKYAIKMVEVKMKFEFEEWERAGGLERYKYPILSDLTWSNANSGVVMAYMLGALPGFTRYPTDKTEDCVNGQYAVSLQTIKGGKVLGKTYPIFAGNLLRGDFAANTSDPLKSLKLGRNHPKEVGKPIYFMGYYKYTPGPVMTGADGLEMAGRTDEMSMYAAIFRVTKGAAPEEEFLDGSTILTSERVVARAEWAPDAEGLVESEAVNGFTEFFIPFKYTEPLDYDKYDYRLTIVCSSSKDGNLYQGAVGSTLIVDDLEIVCGAIE